MYKEKKIDRELRNRFNSNLTLNTLVGLKVSGCGIRGLHPSQIDFKYPITAIAGANGSGKSTLLSLICCAFHNDTEFTPLDKINKGSKKTVPRNYYTYGDFFVFTSEENGLMAEINILSKYLTDSEPRSPKKKGEDVRKKKPSGKWNDYNTRPKRVVSYLGINRIVPPSENSSFRGYKNYFEDKELSEDENKLLLEALIYIFEKNYTELSLKEYKKCRLFKVRNRVPYTSYNMGAGENAVLMLLYEIITAGQGSLIVVDEIELGVHIMAQKRLIQKLKELCAKYECQIICSTHSQYILEELPLDGRVLIQATNETTDIMPEVSSEYAISTMAGKDITELTIFVEDEIGEDFVKGVIDFNMRHRIKVCQIGSADGPIPHQMAACLRENRNNYCVFMDGDKRNSRSVHKKAIKNDLGDRLHLSTKDFDTYIDTHLFYIPGTTWPEYYLMQEMIKQTDFSTLSTWEISDDKIKEYCSEAIAAGKHNEIFTLSQRLGLDKKVVYNDVIRFYKSNHPTEVSEIIANIKSLL